MNEDTLIDKDELAFQQKVLAALQELGERIAEIEKRDFQREMATKPDLELVHKDVQDIGDTLKTYLQNFDRKLDVINGELLQLKADQRSVEKRVAKIEIENRPQVITQDRQF